MTEICDQRIKPSQVLSDGQMFCLSGLFSFAFQIGFAAFSGFALTRSGSGIGSKICIAECSGSRL